MTNLKLNKDDVLYAMVFDKPLFEKELKKLLRVRNCKKIKKGPTEYSLEFYLNTEGWTTIEWKSWNAFVTLLSVTLSLNKERSCLPEMPLEVKEDKRILIFDDKPNMIIMSSNHKEEDWIEKIYNESMLNKKLISIKFPKENN